MSGLPRPRAINEASTDDLRSNIDIPAAIFRTGGDITSKDLTLPPNGGLSAWSQVVAGHLVVFNTFGYINSYGIFQEYYTKTLGRSPSAISWVGSVEIFLVYFGGTFSGRGMDAGYYRLMLASGLFLQALAVFLTSISTQYWQLFLAQGVCQGIGNGLVFCPTIASISTYFSTKRSLALACVACGGATGGMVFPAIAQSLLFKIGFPWTLRVMGFVVLFNAIVILSLARARIVPRSPGPIIDWAAFREPPYVLFTAGVFLILWGTFFAYYYVRPYAHDSFHVTPYTSFSLLLIINGVGAPGRIIPALISDRYLGPIDTLIPVALLGGVLLYCWIAVHSLGGMYAFVALFGLPGGGVQSLFPAAISALTADMTKIGVRIGMVFGIVSFACLSGPPIAGAITQNAHGSYLGAQLFGGTAMVLGSLFVLAARLCQTGFRVRAQTQL